MPLPFFFDSFVLGSLWSVLTFSPAPPSCTERTSTLFGAASESPGSSVSEPPIGLTAFVDVHVVPMDREQVLAHQTVLVEGGRITALGPVGKVPVPAEALRIDGRGKFLMPGLADMHGHPPLGKGLELYLFSYVAHGVTTLRAIDGLAWHVGKIRQRAATVVGPRLYYGTAIQTQARPDSMAAQIAAILANGYSFIQFHESQLPAEYTEVSPQDSSRPGRADFDTLVATIRRLGLPVASHTHMLSPEGVLAFGSRGSVEHMYTFADLLKRPSADVSDAEIQARVTAIARAGTWLTVTLDCTEFSLSGWKFGNVPLARRIVNALQTAGAGILLGADVSGGVGESASIVHLELASMVKAGLTPYQALVTGTRNVAQYFGMLDSAGTIGVGKRADLVLLAGNPLSDIRHTWEPAGVMLNGQWFDRSMLDKGMLADPKLWTRFEVQGGIMPSIDRFRNVTDEQQKLALQGVSVRIRQHLETFQTLSDSLTTQPRSVDSSHIVERQAAELRAVRALLTPEQQRTFDPQARMWLREQARKGYLVAIPGVLPVR